MMMMIMVKSYVMRSKSKRMLDDENDVRHTLSQNFSEDDVTIR